MFIRAVFFMLVVVSMVSAEEAYKTENISLPPVSTNETNPPNSYQYNNRMIVFNLVRLCYERIKPNALYVGVDAWLTWALTNKNSHYHPDFFGFIGEAEIRLGYNYLFVGKNHLTPIIGAGVFGDFRTNRYNVTRTYSYTSWGYDYSYSYNSYKHFHLPAVAYGTFGFLYDHEFNSIFNLGLNIKALIGGTASGKRWGNPVFGFDFTIPITFRFGRHRHWDFRFELFDIYLNGRQLDRNYYGCRCSFGYRF